jgi:protease I
MMVELSGKSVIILTKEHYSEHELWYSYCRLQEAGTDVMLIGSGSSTTYKSKGGLPVTVDTRADQISAADYDGIVIPGGNAPDTCGCTLC